LAHHFLCTNKENDAKEIRRLAFFYLLRHLSPLRKKVQILASELPAGEFSFCFRFSFVRAKEK